MSRSSLPGCKKVVARMTTEGLQKAALRSSTPGMRYGVIFILLFEKTLTTFVKYSVVFTNIL